jgi:hypothetical protein
MIARHFSTTEKPPIFLSADTGSAGVGSGQRSEASAAELPGIEAMAGSTVIGSAEEFEAARSEGSPGQWTEENARGKEEDEKPKEPKRQ